MFTIHQGVSSFQGLQLFGGQRILDRLNLFEQYLLLLAQAIDIILYSLSLRPCLTRSSYDENERDEGN